LQEVENMKRVWSTGFALIALSAILAGPALAEDASSSASCLIQEASPAVSGAELTDAELVWLAGAVTEGDIEVRYEGNKRIATQRIVTRNSQGEALAAGELKCESECKDLDCQVSGCNPNKADLTCTPCTCVTVEGAGACTNHACKYCRKIISIPIDL
jgi:hypothetical protein